jgi:hypothetical protein
MVGLEDLTHSYHIDWQHEEHKIQYSFTQEQLALIATYEAPLKIKLAEEQAVKYREDPDKYCSLSSTASMVAHPSVEESPTDCGDRSKTSPDSRSHAHT